MRLGKEQAAGYVEDTDIDSTVAAEIEISQPERIVVPVDPQSALAAS